MQDNRFDRLSHASDQVDLEDTSFPATEIAGANKFDRLAIPQQQRTIAILNLNGEPVALQKSAIGGLSLIKISQDDLAFARLPNTAIIEALPFPIGQNPTLYTMELGGVEVQSVASFSGPKKPAITLHLREIGADSSTELPLSLEEICDMFLNPTERPNADATDQANLYIIQPAGHDELLCIALHDTTHPAFILIGPETNGHTDTEIGPKNASSVFLDKLLQGVLETNAIAAEVDVLLTEALRDGLIVANNSDIAATDPQHLEFLLKVYRVKCALLGSTVQDSNDKKLHILMPWLKFYEQHAIFRKLRLVLRKHPKFTLTTALLNDLLDTYSVGAKKIQPGPVRAPVRAAASAPVTAPVRAPAPKPTAATTSAPIPVKDRQERYVFDRNRTNPSADFLTALQDIEITSESLTESALIRHLEKIIPLILELFPEKISRAEALDRYETFKKAIELVDSFVDRYLALTRGKVRLNFTHKPVQLLPHAGHYSVFGLNGHELFSAFTLDTAYADTQQYAYITAADCTTGLVGQSRMNRNIFQKPYREIFADNTLDRIYSDEASLMRRLRNANIAGRFKDSEVPAALIADVIQRSKLLLIILAAMRDFDSTQQLVYRTNILKTLSSRLKDLIDFDATVRNFEQYR